jgi:hypothetical protein
MVESAVTLLAMRGLQGTSFSDVLERSGAPRGSIYHHFPRARTSSSMLPSSSRVTVRSPSSTRSKARRRTR